MSNLKNNNSKKTAPKKRHSVQTSDAEVAKKLLAYRDQLAAGIDPIQQVGEATARLRELNDRLHNRPSVCSPPKQKTISEKQDIIMEHLSEANQQSCQIQLAVYRHLKGENPAPLHFEGKEIRGVHDWLDQTIKTARGLNETMNNIIKLLNENL